MMCVLCRPRCHTAADLCAVIKRVMAGEDSSADATATTKCGKCGAPPTNSVECRRCEKSFHRCTECGGDIKAGLALRLHRAAAHPGPENGARHG